MRRRIAGKSIFEALESRAMLSASGLAGAYFARTNISDPKFSRVDSTVNFDWSSGPPAQSLGNDGFSVRWVGQLVPQYTGTYALATITSGGVRVWINKTLIVDHWDAHSSQSDEGKIKFTAGTKYNIRIDYWTDGAAPQIKLEWRNSHFAQQVIPANRLLPASLDKTSPSKPSNLHVSSVSSSAVKLVWDASSDPSGVIAYNVYMGKYQIGTTVPGAKGYVDTALQPATGYTFSVRAIDAAANISVGATTAIVTSAPVNQRPSVPENLHVTGVTENSISLSWSASTDDSSVNRYRVYRDNVLISQPQGTSFTDTGRTPETQYTYTVRSVDDQNLLSNASNAVQGQTSPTAPKDAYSNIDGGDYDQSSGVAVSGLDLINADAGDWAKYEKVDFGAGARSVTLNLALPESNRGGRIELRLDDVNGTLIASHEVQATGSFGTYIKQSLNVSANGNAVSGTHDLYVVFKDRSGVGNVRSIVFSTQHLTTIMALGDSITAGWEFSPNYRFYLWQKLKLAGLAVDFVGSQTEGWAGGPPNLNFDQNHEGYPGITADYIAAHAAGWASDNFPDIVLLHAGTNDMEQGQSVSGTITDLGNIIDALRTVNPNVIVLIAQVIPSGTASINSNINALNALIPDLAANKDTNQSRVIVVDQNTGFTTNDLEDGVHADDSGDQKMADKWYNALLPLFS